MAKGGGKSKLQPRSVSMNASAATVLVDFSKFLAPRGELAKGPPIDEYYVSVAELLRQSADLSCTPQARRLLVVELVACVERYVRSLLVSIVDTCPCSRRIVERKQVSLASVAYYTSNELAFAILDHQALSGQNEIVRATLQMIGLDIKQGSSAYVALGPFERLCQLRHAIVHQAGRLGPNNLLEIDVRATQPVVVNIDTLGYQDLVAICHAAVRAYNQFLFENVIERWAKEGYITGDWINDQSPIEKLCALLMSQVDRAGAVVADEYPKIWSG